MRYNELLNGTIMHYLVYFRREESVQDGTWNIYFAITCVELFGIIINYFYLTFLTYLLLKTSAYHFNLRAIWLYLGCEYYTQLTTRTIQIYYLFTNNLDGNGFLLASLVRCTCYFVVSLLLPAIIAERSCASYFLKDYEHRSRPWISFIILCFITTVSIALSVEFHRVQSTLVLHLTMLFVNLIASAVNIWLEKYNYRKLFESTNLRKGRREYSLAERFQIAENIRTCTMIKTMINCVSLFNLLSTVTVSLDNFGLPAFYENMAATIFNLCVLTYGSVALTVMFCCTEQYKFEAKKLLHKVRGSPEVTPEQPQPVDHEAETDQYFSQLYQDWDRRFRDRP